MKFLVQGTWWLSSKSDPSWNCSGRSEEVGMFGVPKECQDKIEELRVTLGDPPKDLGFGYMKD
jgi:hypothetical protein